MWAETNAMVQAKKGLFSTLLGSVQSFGESLLDAQNRFLSVKVGTDAGLSPRLKNPAYLNTCSLGGDRSYL